MKKTQKGTPHPQNPNITEWFSPDRGRVLQRVLSRCGYLGYFRFGTILENGGVILDGARYSEENWNLGYLLDLLKRQRIIPLTNNKETTKKSHSKEKMNKTQYISQPTLLAKIQTLSIEVGELYAELYRSGTDNMEAADHALEAYKSLRRALPFEHNGKGERHIGHAKAYLATQGF